jgi:hypothetical protein
VQPRATKNLDLLLRSGVDNLELDDLIANERAAARPQGRVDVKKVEPSRAKR